jgi:hypothetical protein
MIVSGQEEIIRNLNEEIRKVTERSRKGLRLAALIVRRESMQRTPVSPEPPPVGGHLRGEHYTHVWDEPGFGFVAEIGTGTNVSRSYAIYVHEILDNMHTVGQARFLATALIVRAKEVFQVIKDNVTIR